MSASLLSGETKTAPTHSAAGDPGARSEVRARLGDARPCFGLEVQAVLGREIQQVKGDWSGVPVSRHLANLRYGWLSQRDNLPGHKAISDVAGGANGPR
jgi:hypothetical protein